MLTNHRENWFGHCHAPSLHRSDNNDDDDDDEHAQTAYMHLTPECGHSKPSMTVHKRCNSIKTRSLWLYGQMNVAQLMALAALLMVVMFSSMSVVTQTEALMIGTDARQQEQQSRSPSSLSSHSSSLSSPLSSSLAQRIASSLSHSSPSSSLSVVSSNGPRPGVSSDVGQKEMVMNSNEIPYFSSEYQIPDRNLVMELLANGVRPGVMIPNLAGLVGYAANRYEVNPVNQDDELAAEAAEEAVNNSNELPVWNENKRSKWTSLQGGWGKRSSHNWNKMSAAWGKRGANNGMQGWNNMNGMWGKRAKWNELSGMWGKRSWNDMSGSWGKRSEDSSSSSTNNKQQQQ